MRAIICTNEHKNSTNKKTKHKLKLLVLKIDRQF